MKSAWQGVALFLCLLVGVMEAGAAAYKIDEIGPLVPGGGMSYAYALNNRGQVVGTGFSAGNNHLAFLWEAGTLRDLSPLEQAFGNNDNGDVVGIRSRTSAPFNNQAAMWRNGEIILFLQNVPTQYKSHAAYDTNDLGMVLINARDNDFNYHPLLWVNDEITDLSQLGTQSEGSALNATGQVVGKFYTGQGTQTRAFLWQNKQMTDLGTLGGVQSNARDINDKGEIVGSAQDKNGVYHACLWRNGAPIDLGFPQDYNSSYGYGINNRGEIVGISFKGGSSRATLWKDGKIYDLNSLLPPESGWQLDNAMAINDAGMIIGQGFLKGVGRSFVLTPTSRPQTGGVILLLGD